MITPAILLLSSFSERRRRRCNGALNQFIGMSQ
jgi:hypothetical protein